MTSEQRLSEQCSKQDGQAFRELYDNFGGRLFSLCLRYIPDRNDAEDALQDSFIKIIHSISSFRYKGEGSLYAWMSRIVMNQCLDRLRKDRGKPLTDIEVTQLDGIADSEPDAAGIESIPEDELIRMVGRLPAGYRAVFNMYAVEGYSHKEIARALGIKEKTSSSQYFKARAMLATMIKEYEKGCK